MSYRDQLIDAEELIEELEKKNKGLEATLERVKQLPQKWRRYTQSLFNECDRCADDLDEALK